MKKFDFFLRSRCLTICNVFPVLNRSAGLTLTDETILSFFNTGCQDIYSSSETYYWTYTQGSKPEKYGDVFGQLLQLTPNHITCTVRCFVDHWKPKELCIPNTEIPFPQQKPDVISKERDAIFVIQTSSTKPSTSLQMTMLGSIPLYASWRCPTLFQSENQSRLLLCHST